MSRSPGGPVALRELTPENFREVLALEVAPDQRNFVAPNAKSIAEAHFHPEAWFRGIYAGQVPVGFLMLHDESRLPEKERKEPPGTYFLWRLMIDAKHQGKGYGRRAVELLADHVRALPEARELTTSFVPGEGSPEGFYRKIGFEPTGRTIEGEVELRLRL